MHLPPSNIRVKWEKKLRANHCLGLLKKLGDALWLHPSGPAYYVKIYVPVDLKTPVNVTLLKQHLKMYLISRYIQNVLIET